MEMLLATASAIFGGGGAAAAGATVAVPGIAGAATLVPAGAGAAAGAAAAGTGLTISSILAGGASVLGLVSSIAAGQAEGEAMDLAAEDAKREQSLETLQGIQRRRSLKLAAAEAIGEQRTAYAASGVDLSFGTAAQAEKEALRELDLGLTSEAGTTETRLARLQERAQNYRRLGRRARIMGLIDGGTRALSTAARMRQRY